MKHKLLNALDSWQKEMEEHLKGFVYMIHSLLLSRNVSSIKNQIGNAASLEELKKTLDKSKETLLKKRFLLPKASQDTLSSGLQTIEQFNTQISEKLDVKTAKC